MKKILALFTVVVFVGCGPKSNEEKAKDLITANMKVTLSDFTSYEPLTYGNVGSAFLQYEETPEYLAFSKDVKVYKDSAYDLEDAVKKNVAGAKERLQVVTDSINAKSQRNSAAKQAFNPEKLFTLPHTFSAKDSSGKVQKTDALFYFDKDFTKVVKMKKTKS